MRDYCKYSKINSIHQTVTTELRRDGRIGEDLQHDADRNNTLLPEGLYPSSGVVRASQRVFWEFPAKFMSGFLVLLPRRTMETAVKSLFLLLTVFYTRVKKTHY